MDMQNYTTPFANTGDTEEFSIDTDPSGKVSLEKGWTELYQLRPEEGGLFILRKVFNQMMKLVSTDTVTWKTQSFPNWIDDKGDGLPYSYNKNAIARATDGENYVSLEDNNEDNPIGSAKWKIFNILDFIKLSDFTGANQSLVANGYQKLPGGLILQWGKVTVSEGVTQNVLFPVAFPNNALNVLSGLSQDYGVVGQEATTAYGETKTGFTLRANIGGTTFPVFWFAIGN